MTPKYHVQMFSKDFQRWATYNSYYGWENAIQYADELAQDHLGTRVRVINRAGMVVRSFEYDYPPQEDCRTDDQRMKDAYYGNN